MFECVTDMNDFFVRRSWNSGYSNRDVSVSTTMYGRYRHNIATNKCLKAYVGLVGISCYSIVSLISFGIR